MVQTLPHGRRPLSSHEPWAGLGDRFCPLLCACLHISLIPAAGITALLGDRESDLDQPRPQSAGRMRTTLPRARPSDHRGGITNQQPIAKFTDSTASQSLCPPTAPPANQSVKQPRVRSVQVSSEVASLGSRGVLAEAPRHEGDTCRGAGHLEGESLLKNK